MDVEPLLYPKQQRILLPVTSDNHISLLQFSLSSDHKTYYKTAKVPFNSLFHIFFFKYNEDAVDMRPRSSRDRTQIDKLLSTFEMTRRRWWCVSEPYKYTIEAENISQMHNRKMFCLWTQSRFIAMETRVQHQHSFDSSVRWLWCATLLCTLLGLHN